LPDTQYIQELVTGCKLLKRESQKAFYQMFHGYALFICMRYCSVEEDAVEIMNDGFLKIFRQLDSFSPQYASYENSLKGWMKRVFINTSIDHYRKYHKTVQQAVSQDNHREPITNGDALDHLSHKEILRLVQKLSPAYRTVFNLYVIDGYKHEEIARILNITVGASKSNLFKARTAIQKLINEFYKNPYERKAV
jgi:RNA polymerase sigma-70 factor (ECF subfamily)